MIGSHTAQCHVRIICLLGHRKLDLCVIHRHSSITPKVRNAKIRRDVSHRMGVIMIPKDMQLSLM